MNQSLKGSLFIITSAFFYASYGVWSRLMAGQLGEFSQAWIRAVILLILIIPYQFVTKVFQPISKSDWKWFMLIGLAGGLNQAPYYYGFTHLPLGTAVLIFYTFLTLAGFVIGKFVFNEPITQLKQASFALGIIGVLVMYRFSLTPDQLVPAIGMSIAGFMGGIAGILPKKLSANYPEAQIMTSYLLVMGIANACVSIFLSESIPSFQLTTPWIAQAGYAISMLIANLAVIKGFKYISAGTGSLIGLVEIIFGVMFGLIFFSETLSVSTIIGGLLVLTAAILPSLKSPFSRSEG